MLSDSCLKIEKDQPIKCSMSHNQINPVHIERYQSCFTPQQRNNASNNSLKLQYTQRFIRSDVLYRDSQPFYPELSLSILTESINCEVVVLEAKWGKFTVILNLLNVAGENPSQETQGICGSYGYVYEASVINKEFVVKCISFRKQKFMGAALSMAIKEIILLKILSALEIGPYVEQYYGFDLIVYQDSVEFAMQKCDKISSINDEQLHSIKKDLLIMHKYSIIHFDIKPDNIMFSPTFKKVVFIDFGLSSIVNARLGQNLEIGFRGTLDYCSSQMINCFESNKPQFVDVYYNDIFSLQNTIKWFKIHSATLCQTISLFDQSLKYFQTAHQQIQVNILHTIKYCLFFHKFKEIDSIFSLMHQQINDVFGYEILYFLYEINPSADHVLFFQTWITTYKKESMEFAELKSVYSSNNYFFNAFKPRQEKKRQFQPHNLIIRLMLSSQLKNWVVQKSCITQLLLQKRRNMNLMGYFRQYLDYISFNNNIHEVGMQQRVLITKLLYKNNYIEEKQGLEDDAELISKTLVLILHKLLNSQKQQQTKKREQVKELIFDLVEHLFILNQLSLQEYLLQLDSIMSSSLLDFQENIEFILKVKHSSIWLLIRFHNNANIKHQQVLSWIYEKSSILQNFKTESSCWLIIYLSTCWKEQLFNLRQISPLQQKMSSISTSLRQLFIFEILNLNLIYAPISQKNAIISQIYNFIEYKDRQKIFFFVIYIYQIYEIEFRDYERALQMQEMIKKNINSPQIFNSLLMKSTIYFMNSSTDINFLIHFYEFINTLDPLSFYLHHFIVAEGIDRLKLISTNIEQQIKLYDLILDRMNQLVHYFELNKLIDLIIERGSLFHRCILKFNYANIIYIKYLSNRLSKKSVNFVNMRNQIIARLQSIFCSKCKQIIEKLCEFEFQRYLITAILEQRNSELENYLFQSCLRSKILNKKAETYEFKYYDKMTHFYMVIMCILDPKYQQLYHGIQNFYFLLKERRQLMSYLNNNEGKMYFIVPTLKEIIKNNSIQEAVIMITSFTAEITINSSSSVLIILFNEFRRFVNESHQNINFEDFFYNLNRYQYLDDGRMNHSNSIYYLIIINRLPAIYLRQCIYLFCKSLPYLAQISSLFLQAHFIRILLIQSLSISYHMNSRGFNSRQTDFFVKRIIKIYKMLSERTTGKILHYRGASIHKRFLHEKALRLGGPFNLDLLGYEQTYARIKGSRKARYQQSLEKTKES